MKGVLIAALMTTVSAMSLAQTSFELGPDSQRQAGVPQGEIIQLRFEESEIYRNTERDWWIYVPDQYDGQTPAALMVFQDGAAYVNETGPVRVPVVFDNLIHKGEMPVTILVIRDDRNRLTHVQGIRYLIYLTVRFVRHQGAGLHVRDSRNSRLHFHRGNSRFSLMVATCSTQESV